jgi:hypothetical protein
MHHVRGGDGCWILLILGAAFLFILAMRRIMED